MTVLDWEGPLSPHGPNGERWCRIIDADGVEYHYVTRLDLETGQGERILHDKDGYSLVDEENECVLREDFQAAVPVNVVWMK